MPTSPSVAETDVGTATGTTHAASEGTHLAHHTGTESVSGSGSVTTGPTESEAGLIRE